MELKDTVLGIELGSTRIKAVLVDETHQPIASCAHDWENQLVDGIWTYSLDMIWVPAALPGKTSWSMGSGPMPWTRSIRDSGPVTRT